MPSLMVKWAILAAWIGTPCSRCKQCCMHATPMPSSTKRSWIGSKVGLLS
jgi:hypothetical protein